MAEGVGLREGKIGGRRERGAREERGGGVCSDHVPLPPPQLTQKFVLVSALVH